MLGKTVKKKLKKKEEEKTWTKKNKCSYNLYLPYLQDFSAVVSLT